MSKLNLLKTYFMRRRRSTKKSKKSKSLKFEVKKSVLREIWAVVYFALAAVIFLSIQGAFGILGELAIDLFRPILGWGIYILPPIFLLLSLMLFFSRKVNFGLAKTVGIILMLVSVLSMIHLSVPIESLYSVSENGQFGGYIGFVTNFFMRSMLNIGNFGSAVIFVAIALISVLLTFEISIFEIFKLLKPEFKFEKNKAHEIEEESENELKSEAVKLASDEVLKAIYGNKETNIQIKRGVQQPEEKPPQFQKAPIKSDEPKAEENIQKEEETHPDYSQWEFPSLDLLNSTVAAIESDDNLLTHNAEKIRSKLDQFGIVVDMHDINVGPTVIQYTLKPHEGVKLSKITSLKNDLALALAAPAIRIEAPIPGKSLVGIEVPNEQRSIVHLREILESKEFKKDDSLLKLPLGRDVAGNPLVADLGEMPHLLIAGATGSGKSVGMNTFLMSLLYQNSPLDLKLILIDPKRVELREYNGIPHLLTPVVTDPEKAAIALRWCVAEMNRRYQLCADNGKRNITDFNADPKIDNKMTTIVVVIDELADLMMASGKEVEASICRIAQMARAVGIHLVIATQRPSVDVITGLIKANIPSRIAFAVSSSIDSRTILDQIGAEDLLGKGDMLYMPSGQSKPVRVQGIYISSKEIEKVTNSVKLSMEPDYNDDIISTRVAGEKIQGIPASGFEESDDELCQNAINIIKENRKASASLLQRRLKIGYARAARLLDILEEKGVIGPVNGAKPRDIFID
ncbi:DNA translocase FtsK 4TM domain-containing protein [Candidatus Peregrinibacteria bacterium]|nr:DNA translocase FtsK 4TM domain-containing protein [Candidatus Peregrinibacteria bacterium]